MGTPFFWLSLFQDDYSSAACLSELQRECQYDTNYPEFLKVYRKTFTQLIDNGITIITISLRIDQGSHYKVEYRWQKVANRGNCISTSIWSKHCQPIQISAASSSSLYSSNGTPVSAKSSIISFAFLSTTNSSKMSRTFSCFLISLTRTSHLPR